MFIIILQDPVLQKWAASHVDNYLSELLRLDGQHYAINQSMCAGCEGMAKYRCLGCEDSRLWCGLCIVQNHKNLPFHRIQVRPLPWLT
jgi:hypothetical protein